MFRIYQVVLCLLGQKFLRKLVFLMKDFLSILKMLIYQGGLTNLTGMFIFRKRQYTMVMKEAQVRILNFLGSIFFPRSGILINGVGFLTGNGN